MLKGVDEINKYLNKWLKSHNFDCTVCFDTDFSYDCINNIIHYAFVIPGNHDKLFLKLCQECRDEIGNCDNFILSFFHELGHNETQHLFSDEEWDKYDELCDIISGKEDFTEDDYINYYKYPIELEATKWACDYIVDHSRIVKNWWDKLQPLIMKFIELNEIEVSYE